MQKEEAVGVSGCLFGLMAMLMSGCIPIEGGNSAGSYPSFSAEVDSIADAGADLGDKTYAIASAIQNIGDEDLEFKQVAKWINNALGLKGYTHVSSQENAKLLIRLAYGRGEPQTTTSTHTSAPGYSYPVGSYWYSVPPATDTVTRTVFNARLTLEAYDLKTPGKLPQVWKTTLTASDLSWADLKTQTPRWELMNMIAASVDYLGTNTGYTKVTLRGDPAGLALIESLKK
jgi:hypothetical protein